MGNVVVFVLLAGLGVSCACAPPATLAGAPEKEPTPGADGAPPSVVTTPSTKVRIDISIMSKCPFGVQAINELEAMMHDAGSAAEVFVDYIGTVGPNGNPCSTHGPSEVEGDIAQLCVHEVAPSRLLDVMRCQNKDYRDVATNWEPCLTDLNIPTDPVLHCINSGDGLALLKASFHRTRERGDTVSPTIHIAGKPYTGPRRAISFGRAVCAAMSVTHPFCSSIQTSPPVNVVVLTDRRCSYCFTDHHAEMVGQRVDNPVIRLLDFSDPEGRKLYDELKPRNLPVIVFDATLDKDPDARTAYEGSLKRAGAWRYLPVGAFNPRCAVDADCQRVDCKETLRCRREMPNRAHLFVVSKCPLAANAMVAMKEVLRDFPTIDFQIHYIATGKSGHGAEEVAESRRAACAIAHYPAQRAYMKYLWCRAKDVSSNAWQDCTGKAMGIDATVLQTCAAGAEGDRLLEASYKSSDALGIGLSSTWVINNRFKHMGIDARTIKGAICEHNPTLAPCAKLPRSPHPQSAPLDPICP